MNWKHVHLIFLREMNDQLRDRRTLFTIAILPMLLYPLLGMLMMQIAQFHREYTVSIRVVGAENWPARSPLLDAHQQLIPLPGLEKITRLVEIEAVPWPSDDSPEARAKLEQASRAAVMADVVDAVLPIGTRVRQLVHRARPMRPNPMPRRTVHKKSGKTPNNAQEETRGSRLRFQQRKQPSLPRCRCPKRRTDSN
ncbi:MAG: hypothetical protein R3C56_25230 [Pirellulaceae bacterium]